MGLRFTSLITNSNRKGGACYNIIRTFDRALLSSSVTYEACCYILTKVKSGKTEEPHNELLRVIRGLPGRARLEHFADAGC